MNVDDKNQAMIEYLTECDAISASPLFFNYAEENEESNHVVTVADDVALQKPYIDGSVLKQYTFQLICYRPLSPNSLINEAGFSDENVENMANVRSILDWILQQEEDRHYPDFGEECLPERLYCLTNDPNLYAVDTQSDPPLAKYSIVIRFEYVDTSKMLFK